MSLGSQSRQVTRIEGGILIPVHQHDLDSTSFWNLTDEILELVREHRQPRLFVDFANVSAIPSVVCAILIILDKKLRHMDCRMIIDNVNPVVYQSFREVRLTENLDIREKG